ncbi:unnamed protein product [Amoebophrya sp. A120]|nr:unnamed protein product [Amoebophrya sp. A120]|eukprot:GSA120T00020268001.1
MARSSNYPAYVLLVPVGFSRALDWGYDHLSKCQGQQKEVASCDLSACASEECLDCVWGSWSSFSACACNGLQERHREIYSHNNGCGKPCDGPMSETVSCEPDCQKPKVDCALSSWSYWSTCSEPCGGGDTFRTRSIETKASNGGAPCEASMKEVSTCNTTPCHDAVDCALNEWSSWGECSKTCGNGEMKRTRTVLNEARFGGKLCDLTSLEEVAACGTDPCDVVEDCVWGDWSYWSACSQSCGGGQKSRARNIDVAPRNGGLHCEAKTMSETTGCNEQSCSEVQDCVIGEWTEWDACSCSCNGIQQRTRHIDEFPLNGGKVCQGALKEIQSCNTGHVCDPPPGPAPIDCLLEEWSDWSVCTAKCGGGVTKRHRKIATFPDFGGKGCDGELEQVEMCNEHLCAEDIPPHDVPINCDWAEWDEWGPCSASCGHGQRNRHREIKTMPNKVGKPCEEGAMFEVEHCEGQHCGDKDCIWSEWTAYGACPCTGLRERSRHIVQHYSGPHGKPCEGAAVETRACQPDCIKDQIDCVASEWGDWSECTATCNGGQQFRQKMIEAEVLNGGRPCQTDLKETRGCNQDVVCYDQMPEDCLMTEWSYWSTCSVTCGEGQKSRERTIQRHPAWGGKTCERESLVETKGCTMEQCPEDVDCVWGEWTEWNDCSATCGNGVHERERGIDVAPRGIGKLCEAKDRAEVKPCKVQECDSPCVDGLWSEWTEFSQCSKSCGGGYRFSSREVLTTPNYCGKGLEGPNRRYEKCNEQECGLEAVDCAYAEWGYWSDCSAPCNGIQDRSRRIATNAAHGGKPCEGSMKEIQGCNINSSDCKGVPVDCILEEWSDYGSCSADCGGGVHRRERRILQKPQNGGMPCHGSLVEVSGCNDWKCATTIDCVWGYWSSWGACSKECGGGTTTRFRHIDTMPSEDGKPCDLDDSLEVESCNKYPCGSIQYCVWGSWSGWSDCSATCGTAETSRYRNLEYSSYEPWDQKDILVTGILAELEKTLSPPGAEYSIKHLLGCFFAGMVACIVGLGFLTGVFRRRQNDEGSSLSPFDSSTASPMLEPTDILTRNPAPAPEPPDTNASADLHEYLDANLFPAFALEEALMEEPHIEPGLMRSSFFRVF